MNQRVIGLEYPIEMWWEYRYDPQRGYVYRAHLEGTNQILMEQLQNDFTANGIASTLRFDLGKGILDVDDSTQQWTLDTWQMDGQSELVSWLLNPFIQLVFSDSYPQVINGNLVTVAIAVSSVIDHLEAGDNQAVAFADPILAPMGYSGNAIYETYPQVQAGQNSYRNDADGTGYVLRHGTNVSNQTQTNVADFGTGQIYTTAQLLSEIGNNGLWINPCPEVLQYQIAHLIQPPVQPYYTIGWEKGRSTRNSAANNRVDIVTTYTFGQWLNAYYDLYTG